MQEPETDKNEINKNLNLDKTSTVDEVKSDEVEQEDENFSVEGSLIQEAAEAAFEQEFLEDGSFEEYSMNENERSLNFNDESEVEQFDGISDAMKVLKIPFKLKQGTHGNILSIHNTTQEQGKLLRIRIAACCFNERATQLIVGDKRGNVSVFDLVCKRYWKLPFIASKLSVIIPIPKKGKQYIIGTKLGELIHIDVDTNSIVNSQSIADGPIDEISYPGKKVQGENLLLLRVSDRAILFDVDKFVVTHRLENDDLNVTLKFACYLPFSEQIFSCFSNDCVHVWSTVTLNTLRFTYPIRARDRKLRLLGTDAKIPVFSFKSEVNEEEFYIKCFDRDYSDGMIICYCCSLDGRQLCFSTLDGYLLLLSAYTFELDGIYRLTDFIVKNCVFLSPTKGTLIMGVTTVGHVVLLDLQRTVFKMIVQSTACSLSVSNDGKLLAVQTKCGEVDVWSTCRLHNALKSQQQCIDTLKNAFQQQKPIKLPIVSKSDECLNENLKSLLKRDRLLNILKEFGCYPAKYRFLIWCALLNLPNNRNEFQLLLKKPPPPSICDCAKKLKLKNELSRTALLKVWSCLAHWCKVFGHSEFLPHLIFPFVKIFSKNSLVCFEICASLLLNHFQLWFEFHPLPPGNYLGMCENILQYFDQQLCKFYADMCVQPVHYAWAMFSNAFSEVFDESQWLCLWDNIISCPPYFPLFCVVAYNINQREVILRLPDKESIIQFFHEQNPVDVCKVLSKAHCLMNKCPSTLHPSRYIKNFQAIPKNCYPKFLNYPQKWVMQQEKNVANIQRQNKEIDCRMRQLELEEIKMIQCLEEGLREEEFAKRMKEMEKTYQEVLKNEEERVVCQRKLLLLYQKEIRNRKGAVLAALKESERRKKAIILESDLNSLKYNIQRERLRNDTKMVMAEEEIRNQDMELLMHRYFTKTSSVPITKKYQSDIKRVCCQRKLLHNELKDTTKPTIKKKEPPAMSSKAAFSNISEIERQILDIQREFKCLTKEKSKKNKL